MINAIEPILKTDFIEPIKRISRVETEEYAPPVQTGDAEGGTLSFLDTLKEAVGGVRAMEQESAVNSYNLAMGYTDDLDSIQIQGAKTAMAIELTTQLVSKAVNAYKEVLQMQV
ncbi:MAG: flagellar hook-basal body complex protein FliE [Oscillospiraceae bacterium]|jgi:flagellar hook-basal body complex protein FliE|nr:flagellar hook-basal body complex protein FliE [Oscillospiraceae bacterium]